MIILGKIMDMKAKVPEILKMFENIVLGTQQNFK